MLQHKTILATIAAVLFGLPIAAPAEQAPTEPEDRYRAGLTSSAVHIWGEGQGFGLAWEHLFNRRFGLGLAAFTTEVDFWAGDDVRMTPITAAALFHLTPDRMVDLYLGPGVAAVRYSGDGRRGLDDDLGPLFEIGFDVTFPESRIGFNLDVKHIFAGGDHDVDGSVTASLGIVARF